MDTKFFYMDEQYIDDAKTCINSNLKYKSWDCLTGVLIPINVHRNCRKRYYEAILKVMGNSCKHISPMPKIHASELFKNQDCSDEVKLAFFSDLVSICKEFEFKLFRFGYYRTKTLLKNFNNDKKEIIKICFYGLIKCLENELETNEIWPVMEINISDEKQDFAFAGFIQNVDYLASIIDSGSMSIHNSNMGELLYSTKFSIYGSITDCISYLLDAYFKSDMGCELTDFKKKLAKIGEELLPLVEVNEIIKFDIR